MVIRGSAAVIAFGSLFFLLLIIAGITSSVSLVEALTSALHDKYGISRKKCLLWSGGVGVIGSILFALPMVVDRNLVDNGTMGLTLLDMVSHWNFDYGLLMVGLVECVLIGWVMGADRIRGILNENSRIQLGPWFSYLIKWIIPALILFLLGWSAVGEFRDGLYGTSFSENYSEGFRWMRFLPVLTVIGWFIGGGIIAAVVTYKGSYRS